jgi:hypothetical protein
MQVQKGTMMKLEEQTTINIPADHLDVETWLFNMTDTDYQGTAKGHKPLGTYVDNGTRGMINVEAIGGYLPVQHYKEDAGSRVEVVMVSPKKPDLSVAGHPRDDRGSMDHERESR